MNPKKILFYTDTPMLGGTENQMLTLAKFLPKEKYPVTLACSKYTALNCWCQQWIEAGFEVIRFPVVHKHDPRHFTYLKKAAQRFDIVHLHLWNPGAARYSFFATEKPIIVTEHDPFVLSGLKGWIKKMCNKKIKKIIVASKASQELVISQDPLVADKVVVIPHGLDNDLWETAFDKIDVHEVRREDLKISENEIGIMCIGELHERKGQEFLINAFTAIIKKYAHAKLFFVGNGPEEYAYKRQAAILGNNVRFLGRRKDVPRLIKGCDIFVIPSKREGFGLVVLEASIAGKAIIGSRVGGIAEIIRDGETGILCTPQNTDELTKNIARFIEDSSLRDTIGKQAHDYVSATYTARRMADETALTYDHII